MGIDLEDDAKENNITELHAWQERCDPHKREPVKAGSYGQNKP